MDGALATTLIVGVLSSASLVALINGLFQRKRDKESKSTGLESKVDTLVEDQMKMMKAQKKQEGDIIRVELKLMISSFPEKEEDILRLAEHYFKDLHGNWVMATTFKQWLNERGLEIPQWYSED
jgi:hypothetical protein